MEEKEFRDKYYNQLDKHTIEELPDFINGMMDESHGYGSICCSVAASAVAAAWAANKHGNAGITGFQAGAVMWEFIRQWNYRSNKTGMKITDYDNMLYAQYEHKFQKTISKSTFESLQKEANRLLMEDNKVASQYVADIAEYEKLLAVFVEKYPDYHDRPKHYERLGCGTGDEWEAFDKKKASGFEFAPQKPYYHAGQLEHWQSIADGVPPFGFIIAED